ncbi:MAG: dTDP-glucose 4,6-dehydratase [candidate division Zixibacteria bacterium]|nr:dTDP-glucose 4,6-dehydratase [candidate division Zixibacteria bacterium]
MEYERRIIITGGAGFIGSNLLLHLVPKYSDTLFINVDCLTYAGNLSNLKTIESADNYTFEHINICDFAALEDCFKRHQSTGLVHLAAESHVDRSIMGPTAFIETNIIGTFNLLELSRRMMDNNRANGRYRFVHVSTDEVFGSLGETGYFTEETPYNPNSPYSASKASSDHLVRSYGQTYGLDVVTTNCSNNYGPYQFPEKLIPLMIRNAHAGVALPVYGDGRYIRDWLYVEDHCRAIDIVLHNGRTGETYNVGGHNEIENIKLVQLICETLDELLGGGPRSDLIEFVKDRPGHDRRYAIDASKIERELGWTPSVTFQEGIQKTIKWYLANEAWLENCITGQYREYYEKMYAKR